VIRDRVDQDLVHERGPASLARHEGGHGGEVATGAVAADGHPVRVDTETTGVVHDPPQGDVGVLGGHRVLPFRRQAVVDARHH
jgi:hypothetical protein